MQTKPNQTMQELLKIKENYEILQSLKERESSQEKAEMWYAGKYVYAEYPLLGRRVLYASPKKPASYERIARLNEMKSDGVRLRFSDRRFLSTNIENEEREFRS